MTHPWKSQTLHVFMQHHRQCTSDKPTRAEARRSQRIYEASLEGLQDNSGVGRDTRNTVHACCKRLYAVLFHLCNHTGCHTALQCNTAGGDASHSGPYSYASPHNETQRHRHLKHAELEAVVDAVVHTGTLAEAMWPRVSQAACQGLGCSP